MIKDYRAGKLKMSLMEFENAAQAMPAAPPAKLKRLGQVVTRHLLGCISPRR
jgi:hypothetical protein